MGFSHYSVPVKPADTFEPLPLEAILQGSKAVYDRGEKNVQKIQGLIDSAYSLPSLQGKDTEVKNQIIQSYMDNVSQLAKGNLTDPKTAAQIESYISRVTRDPQIAGIVERATFAASENKKREEAAAKNIEYLCPTCEEAQEYIQQGVFIADKKFNKTGFNNPEINKQVAEALKDVPKVKDHKIINGRLVEYERYDDSYAERIKEVYAKPNTQMYMDYQFNKKYKDYDFDTEGVEDLQSKLETARSLQQTATQALRLNPKDVSAVNDLQEATTFLERYESLTDDPNSLGDRYREAKRQYEIQDQINRKINMEQFVSESSIKADEFALNDQKHRQSLVEQQAKDLSLGASMMNKSLSEVMRNPQLMAQAASLSQQAKLAEFSQKENIKLQNKIAGKENALQGGFDKFTDSQTVSYNDEKGEAKTIQYGVFKSLISKAEPNTAKRMVVSVMNQKNANDPSWIPLTAEQVSISGTGVERKIKIRGFYGFGAEALPYDDIINISNFTQNDTKPKTETPSNKPKPSMESLVFPKSNNPKLVYKTDVAYDKDESKWYTAPITNTQEEVDNIPTNSHFIYNGELYKKQ